MRAVNLGQLVAAGIEPTQARLFLPALVRYCQQFNLATPLRQAAFVAQCGHESGSFVHLEENLFYTTPERIRAVFPSRVHSVAEAAQLTRNPKALANRVYSLRGGNGDEASGDGWRYRGRGLIQTTFRGNYLAASRRAARDWTTLPDDLLTPDGATLSAAIYFVDHGCAQLADDSAIDIITSRINPAMAGAADRRQRFETALAAFGA